MYLARIEAPTEKFAIQSYTAHLRGLELVVRVVVAQPSVDPPVHYPLVSKSTAHQYRHLRCYCVAPMPPVYPVAASAPDRIPGGPAARVGAGRTEWPPSERPEAVAPEEPRP